MVRIICKEKGIKKSILNEIAKMTVRGVTMDIKDLKKMAETEANKFVSKGKITKETSAKIISQIVAEKTVGGYSSKNLKQFQPNL